MTELNSVLKVTRLEDLFLFIFLIFKHDFKSYEVAKLLFNQLTSIIYHNDEKQITKTLTERKKLKNHGCYVPTIDYMGEKCFDFNVSIK